MIVELHRTSESLHQKDIQEHDLLILEDMMERYGYSPMFDALNEITYYGNDGNFNRTGGSRVRRVKGALQSIPSLMMSTAICWPATLISAIGAVSHRMRKKFEDKNSWMNRLNPMFWNDYLGTYREREGRKKKSSTNDNGKTWVDRAKTALFGAGAAGAGLLAGKALTDKEKEEMAASLTKEDVVAAAFVPYWVTLSNGEILRFRASSPEEAKTLANMVIAYTRKPCYETMNWGIKNNDFKRYRFQFDDGEVCYWAAKTKNEAYEDALTTRIDLCDQMNQIKPDVVELDNLENPKIVGNVEVSREPIPIPEQNKFIAVSTEKPDFKTDSQKKLPSPLYLYGVLDAYKTAYANFVLNFPSSDENTAVDIVKDFNKGNEYVETVYNRMEKKLEMFQVKMKDGDIYYIPADAQNGASELAEQIYRSKLNSIKKSLHGEARESYEEFLAEFGTMISGVKSVSSINPKDYTFKRADEFTLKKYKGRGKEDSETVGRFNL